MGARTFETPIGKLTLRAEGGAVTEIRLGDGTDARDADAVLIDAERELREYFSGACREFTFPIAPRGTEFEKAVWAALCAIPCGETRSYGAIARSIGKPGAARAVGMANRKNPLPIVVPCHRVIGADGSLTGYAYGLEMKKTLLGLEGALK